jgi:two-component system, OmpR family, response regulator MtrA
MTAILLVEDDPSMRAGLTLALGRQGHAVTAVATGEEALDHLRSRPPEIVILDVMLPGIDGFEVCRRIRRIDEMPIIMLTARSDSLDIVVGLEAGADDYVVKPVEPAVLDARIRAALRRADGSMMNRSVYGDLIIDRAALRVTKGGEEVHLTPTELRLLLELTRHTGQALTRHQLLRAVWDHGYAGDSRLVDACVQRLRAKIETEAAAPRLIQTVRGFGYRFATS